MHLPQPGDYIDIHVHGGKPAKGIFILETLMAHENRMPENVPGIAFTYGIHPWFLNEEDYIRQIKSVEIIAAGNNIIAIGEAGFDKLRGPLPALQKKAFREQVAISEKYRKPLIIHCVKAWDEILAEHKDLKPVMPWMIHGYRGKLPLAKQLISKGLYLSIWFEFALRSESSSLIKALPGEKLFLETDGAAVDIRDIYNKVSADRNVSVEELKERTRSNFIEFFDLKDLCHTS